MARKMCPSLSLVSLAGGLVNKYCIVELRNEASVNGQLSDVDNSLNIIMSDAVFTDASGNEYYYDNFFIKERNIRYIHIPPEEDINQLILHSLKKVRKPVTPRVHNYKTSRLMQRQLETLKRVEEIKKEKAERKELLSKKKDEE